MKKHSRLVSDNRATIVERLRAIRPELSYITMRPLDLIKYERKRILKRANNLRY